MILILALVCTPSGECSHFISSRTFLAQSVIDNDPFLSIKCSLTDIEVSQET